jgi:hypothetical protein
VARVTGGTRATDELRSLVAPALRTLRRRLPEIVLGAAVVVTLIAVSTLVGAVLNDRAIAARQVTTTAEVLEGSTSSRTLVRFTLESGEAVVPELGVLHPRGLRPGDFVAVEYDAADPDLVRVAGRTAFDGLPVLLAVVVGAWLVLGPLAVHLRRRRAAAERAGG